MDREELQQAVEEWLALRESEGLRPATLTTYRDHVHVFLLWLDGQELAPTTFYTFFREYARGHSPASCRTIYTSMRVFLRGIGREELVGGMRKPRGDTAPKVIYTEGQMKALFQLLRVDRTPAGLRDHAIVSLLRYGGLRASEACRLLLDDLLEREDAVHIRGGKSRYARRKIPLVAPCPQTLAAYVARGRPALLHGYSDHVFLSVDGIPLTRDSLRQMLRRRGFQVGFPLGAHRFRHTWATAHVRSRTNPASIGYLAGWSPKTLYEMMSVYGHPDIEDLREAQRQAFG